MPAAVGLFPLFALADEETEAQYLLSNPSSHIAIFGTKSTGLLCSKATLRNR